LSEPVPEFGERLSGRSYRLRHAVYAVILGDDGRIATVRTRRGHSLPGGGIEGDETPEEGLAREVREECGRAIALGARLGAAVQWFRAREGFFEGRHVFYAARFAGEPEGKGEHELVWLPPELAVERCVHASHAWAIGLVR
jgi:8-oxo-dGTP diphosphatase